ncbi:MFS transporter [Pseudoroseicyclus aestuarii]|uniref:UMF1 family MFS transporter n=1 Tax=Pseudoroseicyclus aestuarii TaxID=1795041 RepID=A0A318SWV0_9RHOB|nr:MFS transporter [Pseudoroseicyclus aestuarii]PYE84297.1 UMF1 family MFS transporter [Pseudoroseicyclus aestuarii]
MATEPASGARTAGEQKRRIWGWMFFDWAQQPYATLGLTFAFGPYFAEIAARRYGAEGLDPQAAGAAAQSLWSVGQTLSGLAIALTAPVLGAWADASGRKLPWIAALSVIVVACSAALWMLTPDGALLIPALILFFTGFAAGEAANNVANAILPSLGSGRQIGRISGSGAAFGYWGGVLSLLLMLGLLVDNADGLTLLGRAPALGLDGAAREGTRAVGPVIALWYAVFIIPFFVLLRDVPAPQPAREPVLTRLRRLWAQVTGRRSLGAFLLSSMLYRDALGAVYAFGGVYATLVLGWEVIDIGIFGVIGAVVAALASWIGGIADQRVGPKPVIIASVLILIAVGSIIVGMSREVLFGVPLAPGSRLPDIIMYVCGAAIGGAGGSLYAASRTMMTRHADPERPAEAFGLFALSGRATAFLAPMLIGVVTYATGSTQLGFLPVIALFLLALLLLAWVDKDGDRP